MSSTRIHDFKLESVNHVSVYEALVSQAGICLQARLINETHFLGF